MALLGLAMLNSRCVRQMRPTYQKQLGLDRIIVGTWFQSRGTKILQLLWIELCGCMVCELCEGLMFLVEIERTECRDCIGV